MKNLEAFLLYRWIRKWTWWFPICVLFHIYRFGIFIGNDPDKEGEILQFIHYL